MCGLGPAPGVASRPECGGAEACDRLAAEAKAQIQGGSVWGGAAIGAAGGTLAALHGLARREAAEDNDEGLLLGAFFGAVVTIAAGIGAGIVVVKNAGVREAAYGDAMDACLRPAILTRELGPEHPEVGRSLHALAFRYSRQRAFAKAKPLYLRALAILEKSLGVDAPEVATILDDYAALLKQTGRIVEAGELEQRARAIRARH